MKQATRSMVRRPRHWMCRCWFSRLAIASFGVVLGCGEPGAFQDTELETGQSQQALAGYGTAEWAGPVLYWDQNN